MELAAVGVSIAVFNQVSRIAIFPLVSVTTSFVAEEDTLANENLEPQDNENMEMSPVTSSESRRLIPDGKLGSSIFINFV